RLDGHGFSSASDRESREVAERVVDVEVTDAGQRLRQRVMQRQRPDVPPVPVEAVAVDSRPRAGELVYVGRRLEGDVGGQPPGRARVRGELAAVAVGQREPV